MLRVYSHSLGCPKNLVDTERLLGSLGPLEMVNQPEEAELVFVNTCAFIGSAVKESVQALVQLATDLEDMDPRPQLVVGGCLVGRYGQKELAEEIPEVDLWLPTNEVANWPQKLRHHLKLPQQDNGRLLSTGPSYAWLKVGEGCRHQCAFCTIPSIRGKHISTPADLLKNEASALLQQGVKELVLVAQDVSAWGSDLGQDPRQLLEQLLPLPGLERLRLMYLYPAGLTDEFLAFLAGAGKPFVPYFDIPLQHAHPDVLSRMGRPFAKDPQKVIDRVRHYFPEAALRTTMMVGFPGETDEHFRTLMDFAARNRFHHLGVFAYQAEDGTTAALMPEQVAEKTKEERRDELMSLQNGISEEIMEGCLGMNLDVLVDQPHEEWPGLYTGRVWFQAPEVDGITYVSGPGAEPGALVQADIVDFNEYDLTALC